MLALLSLTRLRRLLSEPVPAVGPPSTYDLLLESGVRARALDADSEETSFRRFVAARWGALHRYAVLLTGDHQIAEAVVQAALEQ